MPPAMRAPSITKPVTRMAKSRAWAMASSRFIGKPAGRKK
jgi:hypothetical protein